MSYEDDLKAKIHELLKQVSDRLDPQLDKLIHSDCRVIHDPAIHNELAKAFIHAFLKDEVRRSSFQLNDDE